MNQLWLLLFFLAGAGLLLLGIYVGYRMRQGDPPLPTIKETIRQVTPDPEPVVEKTREELEDERMVRMFDVYDPNEELKGSV